LDLRPTDFSVLVVIGETPGLKQQQLGKALNIQRSNLVIILDQLQMRGLVWRGAVAGDRRSYALTLTPEGASLLAKARTAHERHVRTIARALQGIDIDVMVEGLGRLAAL
jgi:DNA-binding MarR family transcriptional regulator